MRNVSKITLTLPNEQIEWLWSRVAKIQSERKGRVGVSEIVKEAVQMLIEREGEEC